MDFREIAKGDLAVDEGRRKKPYRCTADKLTIGIGRNLEDKGLRDDEIDYLFAHDLQDAETDARVLFPTFDSLSEIRKAVLVNMAFQLGRDRLGGFKGVRAAVASGDFTRAADEMLDSRWATQTTARAFRLAKMMREG